MPKTTELDDFLSAFDEDWVKAGQPSAGVTIAMVQEIKRLRGELSSTRKALHNCGRALRGSYDARPD